MPGSCVAACTAAAGFQKSSGDVLSRKYAISRYSSLPRSHRIRDLQDSRSSCRVDPSPVGQIAEDTLTMGLSLDKLLSLVHQVRGWYSGVELKMSRRQGARSSFSFCHSPVYHSAKKLGRDVTDEQRSRRLIFSSPLGRAALAILGRCLLARPVSV